VACSWGRGGDLLDQAVDRRDLVDDGPQGLACLADQADAGPDLLVVEVEIRPLISLGGVGRTLSQGADLLGHDREAATRVAGPGGLDPSVEGQQVGLEGDFVDDADDLRHLLR
jgi:hypothetical protein